MMEKKAKFSCNLTSKAKEKKQKLIKLLGKCAIWRIGYCCRIAVLSPIRHFAFSVVFQTFSKELETQLDLYEFRKF